jgi:hypothetical protein
VSDVARRRRARLYRLSVERQAAPRRRRWAWVLIALAFGLGYATRALAAQPVEGALGRFPLPEIIGMRGAKSGAKSEAAVQKSQLTLLVRPQLMLQRGDIRLEARVPRHADNRRLAIAWTSDVGSAGATQRQIDGEDGPVLHVLMLSSQPPANYLFVATVIDRAGKACARAEASIHAPEESDRW